MKDKLYSEEIQENIANYPSMERLKKGPIAVIECFEEIPCNPCEAACPFYAITIGEDITKLPMLDENKCKGCGLCITFCPGMAIFVVNLNYSEKEALVIFPYEFLPIPKVGSIVNATNRQGEVVAKGRVVKVQNKKESDHTVLISLAIPKNFINTVRGIQINETKP